MPTWYRVDRAHEELRLTSTLVVNVILDEKSSKWLVQVFGLFSDKEFNDLTEAKEFAMERARYHIALAYEKLGGRNGKTTRNTVPKSPQSS